MRRGEIRPIMGLKPMDDRMKCPTDIPDSEKIDTDDNKNEEYEVEQILDKKQIKRWTYYLVKWKGWTNRYNSWVLTNKVNAPEHIRRFKSSRKNQE